LPGSWAEDELVSVGEGAVGVLQPAELISEVLEQRGHQTLVSRCEPYHALARPAAGFITATTTIIINHAFFYLSRNQSVPRRPFHLRNKKPP